MHKDTVLVKMQNNLKLIETEMAYVQALVIEHMLLEESSVLSAELGNRLTNLEETYATLSAEVENYGTTTTETFTVTLDYVQQTLNDLGSVISEAANQRAEQARESAEAEMAIYQEQYDAKLQLVKDSHAADVKGFQSSRAFQRMSAKEQEKSFKAIK